MSEQFVLEPEVAGGWGPQTRADTSVHPPIVHVLHHEFEGWLGDDLLETFPCYLVTERLGESLHSAQLTGFNLGPVQVTASEAFSQLHPHTALPSLKWLQISGSVGRTDFAISPEHQLIVSARALGILRSHQLKHCEVSSWPR